MVENEYDSVLEKVYEWVGQRLSSCPVRDGLTFYNGTEKVFKVVRKRRGWHLQFCIPVPESPGLKIFSAEEAKKKKLGRARWIYEGQSEKDAENLVKAALVGYPQRRVIEPAMSRDSAILCEATCPCFKKMERLLENKSLPDEITNSMEKAYNSLSEGQYLDFVVLLDKTIEDITSFLLREHGIEAAEWSLSDKINRLSEMKVISRTLKEEVDVIFNRRNYEEIYPIQERAYPMALMLVAFASKLLRFKVK